MILQTLKLVFGDRGYVLLAATTGFVIFVFTTWLPNLDLVWQITVSRSVPLADKARILAALVGSIGTNFTIFSVLTIVAIAVLFGANLAVTAYYFRVRPQLVSYAGQVGAATSFGGLASGLFGVGCAACGTFVLSPIFSFIGASSLVALLPFGGEEFAVLGVGLLSLSLVLSARTIGRAATCSTGLSTE